MNSILVIQAGTPRSSKPAESDLMKVLARVITPISNVSIATRRKRREGPTSRVSRTAVMTMERDNYDGMRPPYTRGEFGTQWLPEGLQPDEGPFCRWGIARSLSDVT
jgi:hypothetical protein